MTIARSDDVSYTYPRSPHPALQNVSIAVERGEFALLAGPSGGGKSTLLRLFNGLVPQFHGGTISGSVRVAGLNPTTTPPREMALHAGMVFQEPEAQGIAETVIEEVSFGLEQRAIPRPEMHRRVDVVLAQLGIDPLRHRRLHTLSGGERQRVAIASVLVLQPGILLLDEPTSQLDSEGAIALLAALNDLHLTGDLAILVSEHRLDRLLPVVGRVLEVKAGAVTSLTPREAASTLDSVPPITEMCRRLGLPALVDIEGARRALPRNIVVQPSPSSAPGETLLRVDGVSVAYGEHLALRDASFSVRQGEAIALIGPNGSGKTTLFRALTGLSKLVAGRIYYGIDQSLMTATHAITAFAGLVPQDPALALYRETVAEEITETIRYRSGRRGPEAGASLLAQWGLAEFGERNPRDISVGQQQRVAIAAMLAHRPPVWLMDEPTRGADGQAKLELAARIRAHAAAGGAAIVATHDIESAAHFATRVITLEAGSIQSDLPAREAFSANGPHPTQVAGIVPGAIRADEVSLVPG